MSEDRTETIARLISGYAEHELEIKTLISLLIDKGIFTKEEFEQRYKEADEEMLIEMIGIPLKE